MVNSNQSSGMNKDQSSQRRFNWNQAITVLAAVLFMWLVWPTPYQYFKSGSTNERTNRLTGHVEVLTSYGWRAFHEYTAPLQPTAPATEFFSAADLASIQLNATMSCNPSDFTVVIHNPTNETISGANLHLATSHNNGIFSMDYVLLGSIPPKEDGSLTCSRSTSLSPSEIDSWNLTAVSYSSSPIY